MKRSPELVIRNGAGSIGIKYETDAPTTTTEKVDDNTLRLTTRTSDTDLHYSDVYLIIPQKDWPPVCNTTGYADTGGRCSTPNRLCHVSEGSASSS